MKSVVVGTAGHIDHGKSALVQALTGTDPDRLKEEKARGITIDLGFAHHIIDGVNFAFVDVPGHERFVKNMLAGVGGIDLVVLVVAADESVMPQTREHFDICRLLQVPAGLVALTKADLVDDDTLELARLEVRDLVAGSFLEHAPILAVSSRTGAGLDLLRTALVEASTRVHGRSSDAAARLPIDRVFSMKGFGTVVTGTLVSGRISIDDELAVAPGNDRVKVRGVQVHGQRQREAVAGQRAAINLGGIEVDALSRGQNLVTAGAFQATRVADAAVELLENAKPLKHGTRVRFHQGTAEILGRVAIIGPWKTERRTQSSQNTQKKVISADSASPALNVVPAIVPGMRAFVRVRLEAPAMLARGDRYILRAYSPPVTIAGGVILDPQPPRGGIRNAAALERCARLAFEPAADEPAGAERRAAAAMIEGAGAQAFPLTALTTRAGVPPRDVSTRVADLVDSGVAVVAGEVLVAAPILRALSEAIVEALADHHRVQPLSEGIPREELRDRLFAHGHRAVFERALADLAAAGRIIIRDRIALASHRLELTPEEERGRAALEQRYRDAGLTPPDLASAAAAAGVTTAVADRMLKLLLRQKVLVRVDTLVFHDEALKRLKSEVTALKTAAGAAGRIDVSTFKERFGVSRKFAIPLLEYLDRERLTRRVGDSRVIL
jgi:selenocysteine-specific elongation factor